MLGLLVIPHPISAFGAFHTVLSLIPVAAGRTAFVQHGRIDPASGIGKVYLGGMLASILTFFGLSSTGHFNAGHALGILALIAMLVGAFTLRIDSLGRAAAYLQMLAMCFSFVLLLVPENPGTPRIRATPRLIVLKNRPRNGTTKG